MVRKLGGRWHTPPCPVLPLMGGTSIHHEDEGCCEDGSRYPGWPSVSSPWEWLYSWVSASIQLEELVSCIPAKRRQHRPTGATAAAASSSSSSPSCSRAQPPLPLLPPWQMSRGKCPSRQTPAQWADREQDRVQTYDPQYENCWIVRANKWRAS